MEVDEMFNEFGKYLLDISKLVFAGVVVDNIFNGVSENRLVVGVVGIVVAMLFCTIGIILISIKKGGRK
jgi:hypothetical protein